MQRPSLGLCLRCVLHCSSWHDIMTDEHRKADSSRVNICCTHVHDPHVRTRCADASHMPNTLSCANQLNASLASHKIAVGFLGHGSCWLARTESWNSRLNRRFRSSNQMSTRLSRCSRSQTCSSLKAPDGSLINYAFVRFDRHWIVGGVASGGQRRDTRMPNHFSKFDLAVLRELSTACLKVQVRRLGVWLLLQARDR